MEDKDQILRTIDVLNRTIAILKEAGLNTKADVVAVKLMEYIDKL